MSDWLDAEPEQSFPPAEQIAAEKNQQEIDTLIAADHFAMPAVSETALVAAEQETKEREAFTNAWSNLIPLQQLCLRALQQVNFSVPRALKVLNAAIAFDPSIAGSRNKNLRLTMHTVKRWTKEHEPFKIVLAALKAEAATQVTSRDDLLLRAHRAAEYAEEEQPILHKGADTGFRERKPDVMLRANEQLMKATKVLGGDERVVGGGTGPAFIIQVIQGDGQVKDVTPRGVTIDLPAPDGT